MNGTTLRIVGAAALVWFGANHAVAQENATNVAKLIREVTQQNENMAKAQKVVEDASDETTRLLTAFRSVQKRNEALRVYNQQLETLLASQSDEQSQLEQQIGRVSEVSRQVTPLMLRMVDALAKLVAIDVPFLAQERSQRVRGLKELLVRTDVSESEKFRRILEAYQIENDYGRTVEAYRDTLTLDDQERSVDVLRVGRVALIAATLDRKLSVYWDRKTSQWQPLPTVARRDLAKAFRIARKQGAPDLLRIPVIAPEEAS